MTGWLPQPPTLPRATGEGIRVRQGVLRYVRDAAERGVPLPGELELTERLGCTRQQLRRALLELEKSGVLHRRQGAATTVDPMGLRMSVRLEEQFEHTELLSRMGYQATMEVVSRTTETLPRAIAALLEAPPSSRCDFTLKRWFADGHPAMVAEDRLVHPAGRDAEPIGGSVYAAVIEMWSDPIIWEIATPGVALVDDAMSELLDMPVGAPVMTLEQIGVTAGGYRRFHSFEYHHPGFVSYSLVRTVRPPWGSA